MRVRLFKLAADTYQFVRSYHILMELSVLHHHDGLLKTLRGHQEGRRLALPAPRPYKDLSAHSSTESG